MNFALVLLLAAAPLDFAVDAGSEGEVLRFANYRCSSPASRVLDGGTNFFCPSHPGIDLTVALRASELVITGEMESYERGQATVIVSSVLKGQLRESKVTFAFQELIGPKRIEGVWLLVRVRDRLEDSPAFGLIAPESEPYVRQLLAEAPCPAKRVGVCEFAHVCSSAAEICRCEYPCDVHDVTHAPPPTWHCMPRECWSATDGAACSKPGLVCENACGPNERVCLGGRWGLRKRAR